MPRLMDADKYCEFLNNYPIEKAQKNFMIFYRDALQYTFECEAEAIPVEWIKKYAKKGGRMANILFPFEIEMMIEDWEKENESNT